MRLYIVGVESMLLLADFLRDRDVSFQIITDGRRTGEIACSSERQGCVLCRMNSAEDIPVLLRVWAREGRFSLVPLGEMEIRGKSFLFAAPVGYVSRPEAAFLFKKVRGDVP